MGVARRSVLGRVRAQGGEEGDGEGQRASYLAQCGAMFSQDAQLGRRTIDTCEGGALKRSVETMTLDEALGVYAPPGSLLAPADE